MPIPENIPPIASRSCIPTRPESKKSRTANEPTELDQNKESAETVEPTIRAVEPTPARPRTHDSTPSNPPKPASSPLIFRFLRATSNRTPESQQNKGSGSINEPEKGPNEPEKRANEPEPEPNEPEEPEQHPPPYDLVKQGTLAEALQDGGFPPVRSIFPRVPNAPRVTPP